MAGYDGLTSEQIEIVIRELRVRIGYYTRRAFSDFDQDFLEKSDDLIDIVKVLENLLLTE